MKIRYSIKVVAWYPENETKKTACLNLNADNWKNIIMKHTDCPAVAIVDKSFVMEIPKNLNFYNPCMTSLNLANCGLTKITKEDLNGLHNLKDLHLRGMKIQELPADLFSWMPNLEIVNFSCNDLTFIGKDIFRNLKKLKFVDLSGNPSINLVYVDHRSGLLKVFDEYKFQNTTSRIFRHEELNAMIDGIFHSKPQAKSALEQLLKSKDAINVNHVYEDIQKTLRIDEFKDFTIKIDENEFKVHKLMLAARSTTLAEMIKNNPDADELILTDIDVETLKIILTYIYDDEMPENYTQNSEKVFAAAGKLKIKKLQLETGIIICNAVEPGNSFEMLKLATKYNHEELKKKSFAELKKFLNDESLKEEVMNNLELLTKVVKAKRDYEEKMKQMKDEFENII